MRITRKIILRISFFLFFGFLFLTKPGHVDTANFTNASATMRNSRLSFYAKLNGTAPAGATTFRIKTSGVGDTTVTHLYPRDTVNIGAFNTGPSALTVNTLIGATAFTTTTGLGTSAVDNDDIFVKQESAITVSIGLATTIPAGGYIQVFIPAGGASPNNGIPESGASVSAAGFDSNGVGVSQMSISGGTGCTWNTNSTWTWTNSSGGASATHVFKAPTTTACNGGTVTIGIGNTARALINPAPLTSGHSIGTADVYTLNIKSYDPTNNVLDTVDTKVAPIEAIMVSATVDQTLSFSIAGVSSGTTAPCGATTNVSTTATAVPWGTVSTYDSFYNAAHQLTVSTNATNGYSVTIEENDQMGKDGITCTGATAGESVSCIKDSTCDAGSCTESTQGTWKTATNNGFAYALNNASGTDASLLYTSTAGGCSTNTAPEFCARQIADQESTETKATVMSKNAPANGSSVYACYRLSVSATQPAGYYYNFVRYTATPSF